MVRPGRGALDVLPFIVPADDWEPLTRGLRQRARLLNAIAADLYGTQRLLAEGLVPPALVFGASRVPARRVTASGRRGGTFLHLVAFDLGARPRRALARGRHAHAGAVGRRLRAREPPRHLAAVPRRLPRAARASRSRRFFRTLQETLLAAAPCDDESPHVVLLTPGPYNETYFEHAYLARYLGFTLAEGSDLDGRVTIASS